ncbi:MAG: hypothetical protein ACYC99_01580, partial [Candidatus Geothermincolia bacterium]
FPHYKKRTAMATAPVASATHIADPREPRLQIESAAVIPLILASVFMTNILAPGCDSFSRRQRPAVLDIDA